MASWGVSKARKISGGKYHWKLMDWVNQLFYKYDSCLICGKRKDLEPHHVVKVKPYDDAYASLDNGVVLCKHCHHEYHARYSAVNAATLLEFAKLKIRK